MFIYLAIFVLNFHNPYAMAILIGAYQNICRHHLTGSVAGCVPVKYDAVEKLSVPRWRTDWLSMTPASWYDETNMNRTFFSIQIYVKLNMCAR